MVKMKFLACDKDYEISCNKWLCSFLKSLPIEVCFDQFIESVQLLSLAKYIWKSKQNQQNWTISVNFDISLSVNFDPWSQTFIYEGETRHLAVCPPNFEIFLVFPNFLTSSTILSCKTTGEATRIQGFSQQIARSVSLVAYQACAKTLQSSKILWRKFYSLFQENNIRSYL